MYLLRALATMPRPPNSRKPPAMKRDYDLYPDDEDGDLLWQMLQDGDNLDEEREVDFSVIFPREEMAMKFAEQQLRNGQKVSFGPYDGNLDMPWQVQIHPVMAPSHENITAFEAMLDAEAEPFDGVNDGWGCFAVE